MDKLNIDAHISEIDGAYYPVKLHAVPRVGELIDLWSFIDQNNGDHASHYYEVVQVVHKLHDVTDEVPNETTGMQFITVYVKPSSNSLFAS